MTKRFSLKNKLILIFGALIAAASVIEGVFAVRIARKAVSEKVEAHLTGKARCRNYQRKIGSIFSICGRTCSDAGINRFEFFFG